MEEIQEEVVITEEDIEPSGEEETPEVEAEELDAEESEEAEGEDKTPPWLKKRIDKMARQKGESERRAEAAERRAERVERLLEERLLKEQAKEEKEPAYQPTRQKPTLESCEFDTERYADELTDWKIEQRETQQNAKRQKEQQAQQQQKRVQTYNEKGIEASRKGADKYEDFQDAINSLPLNNQDFTEALLDTEAPEDVTYYLYKNPSDAATISKMEPRKMAMALARLESKAVVPPKPKQTTKAPKPVEPVGSQASAESEPDAEKDPDGWYRWEQARLRKLGRLY